MAWWTRRSREDVAEIAAIAVEKAVSALTTAQGRVTLPDGTQTMNQQQAIALASHLGMQTNPLPRNPLDGQVPFGPATPLIPRPIDAPGPWGRPAPRRTQYEIAWNLRLTNQRPIPFEVLRAAADQCDVARRCIDIRKHSLQEKTWDIALTAQATAAVIAGDESIKSAQRAQTVGRQKLSGEIERIRAILEEPDRQNGENWSAWLGNLTEEHMVWDALTIWPVFPTVGAWVRGQQPLGFRILDGSTIKPLLDENGNRPAPPYPAFQQILYGFPRGEFTSAPDYDQEFSADQLFYAPRDIRSTGTWPFGSSPTEKALPSIDLWLKRQAWWREEWEHGVLGRAEVMAKDATWDETDRKQMERNMNDAMSGNTVARQQFHLWPGTFDFVFPPQLAEKYKPDLDEFLIKQIGSKYAVMPTQLGVISPRGFFGTNTAQAGEQNIDETEGDGPLEEWIVDVVNGMLRRFAGMPPELTLLFTGGGTHEDDAAQATTDQVRIYSAQKTLNDIRAENGDSLYSFPEADMPFVMTASGPEFMEGSSEPEPAPPVDPVTGQTVPGKATPGAKATAAVAKPPAARETPTKGEVTTHIKSQVADEAETFLTFAQRRQGKSWRDFEFAAVTPSLAKALNTAGQRGDLEACKVLVATVPKSDGGSGGVVPPAEPPNTLEADRLAAEATPPVTAALAGGWTAGTLLEAVEALVKTGVGTAFHWALQALGFPISQAAALESALTPSVTTAVDMGWESAAMPGTALPEEMLRQGALGEALSNLRIDLRGVSETSVTEIGNQLATSVAAGESTAQTTARLDGILHDEKRAEVIARTEIARAMEASMLAMAKATGGMDKEWLDAPGACPVCVANAAQGAIPLTRPFRSGDPNPPAHPRCRCALALVPSGTE